MASLPLGDVELEREQLHFNFAWLAGVPAGA